MRSVALPGAELAERSLVLATVPIGAIWRRLYGAHFPDPLGWGPAPSRFSDPTGGGFGVVYLGVSAKVTFVETILRDRANGRGADCIVSLAQIEACTLASIRVAVPLRVVDLTGDGLIRMGVPSDVVGAQDHTLSRAWSQAFHSHPDAPDGVLYPSRLNEERCLAIYSRGCSKLEAVSTPRLVDCRSELAAILDDLDIAIG